MLFNIVSVAFSELPNAKIEFVKKEITHPAIKGEVFSLAVPHFEKPVFKIATKKEVERKTISPVARSDLSC